jgi:hypothetical protein
MHEVMKTELLAGSASSQRVIDDAYSHTMRHQLLCNVTPGHAWTLTLLSSDRMRSQNLAAALNLFLDCL